MKSSHLGIVTVVSSIGLPFHYMIPAVSVTTNIHQYKKQTNRRKIKRMLPQGGQLFPPTSGSSYFKMIPMLTV